MATNDSNSPDDDDKGGFWADNDEDAKDAKNELKKSGSSNDIGGPGRRLPGENRFNGINGREPVRKRNEVVFPEPGPDEMPLEFSYSLSYFKRPPGNFNPQEYSDHVQNIATFKTVGQFWQIYSFLRRPSDINEKIDFHLFKKGIKPVWEDEANRNGGKWIIRLKKGVASRIWENLILAMIGEQFMVGEEICGAVCSIRNQEDIVSLWNRTASEPGIINRIRDTMKRVLNLPPSTVLEYKRHDDCLKDQTSYRNTTFKR